MRKQQLKKIIREEIKSVVKETRVATDVKDLTKLLQKKDAKITVDKKNTVYVNGVEAYNADANKSASKDYKYRYQMLKHAYDKSQNESVVKEASYRVVYVTKDGEKGKSRVFNNKKDADSHHYKLTKSKNLKTIDVIEESQPVTEAYIQQILHSLQQLADQCKGYKAKKALQWAQKYPVTAGNKSFQETIDRITKVMKKFN